MDGVFVCVCVCVCVFNMLDVRWNDDRQKLTSVMQQNGAFRHCN